MPYLSSLMEAHMDATKLKVKIGQHEFEAEGPQEVVEKQFETFRQLISEAATKSTNSNRLKGSENSGEAELELPHIDDPREQQARKIFHVEGDLLTLGVVPQGDNQETDAALLILLGHKIVRKVDMVSADDLLNGMKQSGVRVDRADRVTSKTTEQGMTMKTGVRRGTKYRLTTQGVNQAFRIAEQLASLIA